jgi:hypothetical protein
MPVVCLYCSEVFFPSLHRVECPDCGFFLTEPLHAEEA